MNQYSVSEDALEVYYLECGGSNTSTDICPNSPDCIHYVQFYTLIMCSVSQIFSFKKKLSCQAATIQF